MKRSSSPLVQPRLYELLADRILKEHVEKTPPGSRLPTEIEFSKIYHVSVPTVREALRSLVQSGLLTRRQGSGTYRSFPPREAGLQSPSAAKVVAIVTPMDLAEGGISCYYSQLIFQIHKSLQTRGIATELFYGETPLHSPRQFDDSLLLKAIKQDRIASVVILGEDGYSEYPYRKELEARGIEFVTPSCARASNGLNQNHDFILKSVQKLVQHSRRKLACIGFGAHSVFEDGTSFEKIVSDHGGITDKAWMIGDLHPVTVGSGYSLLREVWTTSRLKPDGLIICDDVLMNDSAMAIQELGIKCPDQLMIACLRNEGERVSTAFPFIQLKYNARELALQLANLVSARIFGEPESPLFFDPTIIDPFVEEEVQEEVEA